MDNMAPSPPAASPPAETILFRPSKKRKVYRRRAWNDDVEDEPAPVAAPATIAASNAQTLDELIGSSANGASEELDGEGELEGARVSIAEILRLRKRNKRVGGVEFRAEGHVVRDDEGRALVVMGKDHEAGAEGEQEQVGKLRKFAPQTGTVGDVDRHMMAYIDSELAKRRDEGLQASQSSAISTNPRTGSTTTGNESMVSGQANKDLDLQRQPAALGKLLEIDLGDEARNRNVERTNQARRRLDGEEVEEEGVKRKPGKVRLGPDGRPWRGRKRRASEDVKRDKLVEEVLRENRLEIYDEAVPDPPTINNDQAADDRIAEAFRKEFMDAVSQRQRKKAGPAPPPSRSVGGKKEEEVLKGPKLGGSRNARAAMRETMLKSGKK